LVTAFCLLKEYEQGLKHYEEALDMRLSFSQKPQSDEIIGHIHCKMGGCLHRVGLYAEALSYFYKSEANSGASSKT